MSNFKLRINSQQIKSNLAFYLLILVIFLLIFFHYNHDNKVVVGNDLVKVAYDPGQVIFLFVSSCLVFIMLPGVAFFYGGLVHRKNFISTIIESMVAAGVVSLLWITVLFSMCFGKTLYGFVGNPMTFFCFDNVHTIVITEGGSGVPIELFATFQLMFAILTPAIVVGAVAERIRFFAFLLFIILFLLFVYAPIAHWAWSTNGFLYKMGVEDYAGGLVVHITAGCAALAGAFVLKPRSRPSQSNYIPEANIPFVLLGTALLWFGWFGFNAGSGYKDIYSISVPFLNTNLAAASGGMTWMLYDKFIGNKPSVLGFCIGAIVGLVAITPSAGYVDVQYSVLIGFVASVISFWAVRLMNRFTQFDDALDVFPCHGIGGMVGMVLTGVFASNKINHESANGLIFGGYKLFFTEIIAMVIVVVYSFVVSFLIFKFINLFLPIRVSASDEEIGLDLSEYEFAS